MFNFLSSIARKKEKEQCNSIYFSICKLYGKRTKLMNINIYKEDITVEELIKALEEEKAKYVAEKSILESENLDVVVAERLRLEEEKIRAEVLKEHGAKLADVEIEIKALDNIIARKLDEFEKAKEAELEQAEVVEPKVPVEG